jgi:biopolymer transport protein ExbB
MKRKLLITGIVAGSFLALGPLWGLLGTVFGMMGAFRDLAGEGISDPRVLSGHIGQTLLATSIGFIACPIGLALLIPCIVVLAQDNKKQPPALPVVD